MKRKISLLLVLVLILSTLTNIAVAEEAVPISAEAGNQVLELSIDDAVKLAIESDRNMWKIDDQIKQMQDLRRQGSSDKDIAEQLMELPLSVSSELGITQGYLKLLLDKNGYSQKTGELKSAEIVKEKDKLLLEIEKGVKTIYYGILLAEKSIDINEAKLIKANEQLRVVNLKFNNGSATKAEVLSGEMAVQEARSALDSAVDSLNLAMLNLLNLLNLPFDKEVVLTDKDLTYVPTEEINLEEAIAKAKEKRLEILSAKNDLELQKIETHAYKAYYTSNLRQHKYATEKLKDAELNVPQAYKTVELNVRENYLSLIKSERTLLNAEKTLELAKESARINKLLYDNGMATTLDVLNADEKLADAEIYRYKCLSDYNMVKFQFDNSHILKFTAGAY